jgi:hypothetical protein
MHLALTNDGWLATGGQDLRFACGIGQYVPLAQRCCPELFD